MDKENENTSEIKNEDETVNDESNSKDEQQEELSQEDKLSEIEDKLTRSYAELENQRRRYEKEKDEAYEFCLLYTSPSPRDAHESRMPSSA